MRAPHLAALTPAQAASPLATMIAVLSPPPESDPRPHGYTIGCRWRADRVETWHRDAGTYECMNPMIYGALTATELQAQRALQQPMDVKTAARVHAAFTAKRV